MPLIVNLSIVYFMEADQAIALQFGKVLQVFVIVLVPVVVGMLIRRFRPGFAHRMDKPVRVLSALFLGLAIALALSPALLNNPTIAIPAAIYGVLALFTAAAFGWTINRLHGEELAAKD